MKRIIALAFIAVAFGALPAFADAIDCDQACPDGQVMSSFLDGPQVSCVCQPVAGGMVDDTNVQYGGEGVENTSGGADDPNG